MWCNNLTLEAWQDQVSYEEYCYLHGFCNDWVYNNFKDGDKILLLYALNEEFTVEHLIHCCLIRNGLYVDVRGETDDWNKMIDGFDDFIVDDDYVQTVICSDLSEFIQEMKNLGLITD